MRTKSNYRTTAEADLHRDRWLISYADLVTLLLALFIVLFAASDKERARSIAANFTGQTTTAGGAGVLPGAPAVDQIDPQEIKFRENPLIAQKTKIQQTSRGLVVSLAEAGFFAPGEAALGAEAEAVVGALAESLKDSSVAVRVEGHTDSVPISTARYASNWELSTARASNVLQKLLDKQIAPERLSASGYGGFQPVADNAAPEGRAQNRRVDIVILNR